MTEAQEIQECFVNTMYQLFTETRKPYAKHQYIAEIQIFMRTAIVRYLVRFHQTRSEEFQLAEENSVVAIVQVHEFYRSTVSRATQLEIRKLETIRHNFKNFDAPHIGLIGPRWVSLKYSQFTIHIYISPGDIVKISTKNIQNYLNIIVTTTVNRNHKIFNVAYKKCSEITYSYAIHGKGQPRKPGSILQLETEVERLVCEAR